MTDTNGTVKIAPVYNDLQSVLDATTTPPASPSLGDSYLVLPTAIGVWTGDDNTIATWSGASWSYYTPNSGDRTSVTAGPLAGNLYAWNGSAWTSYLPVSNNWRLGGNVMSSLQKIGSLNSYDFALIASGTERMRVTAGGNVGIGNAAPTSLLSIGTSTGISFSTAGSTFSTTGGINIMNGCYSINGVCIGSNRASGRSMEATYRTRT